MLHNRPLKTTAALTLVLALATAAPASARPIDLNSTDSYPSSPVGTASTAPTIVHVTGPSGGFDWGDAGIGAAGGLALSILGVGSALAVSGHRTRRQTMRRA
jgi:hypothetical protein